MPTGKRGPIGMIKPAGKDLSSLRPYEVIVLYKLGKFDFKDILYD